MPSNEELHSSGFVTNYPPNLDVISLNSLPVEELNREAEFLVNHCTLKTLLVSVPPAAHVIKLLRSPNVMLADERDYENFPAPWWTAPWWYTYGA